MANVTHKDKSDQGSGMGQSGQPGRSDMGGNLGGNLGNQAKGTAQKVGDEAKKVGERALDEVKGMASTAMHKAEDAASYVGHKTEDATGAVGHSMKSLSGTIREHSPKEGMMANAGQAVADTLESSGRYLEEHGLKDIGEDLTNMIRRNPIPALLLGVGIGYLLARATRS